MECVICKTGETEQGTATITLERNGATLVFRKVPAQVCNNCGEEYVDEAVTAQLLKAVEESARAGVQMEIREYVSV